MNKIIQSWHEKGLHSPEEIAQGDTPKRQAPARAGEQGRGGELERMKKIYDKVRRG